MDSTRKWQNKVLTLIQRGIQYVSLLSMVLPTQMLIQKNGKEKQVPIERKNKFSYI